MEIIFHSHANKTHFHKKGCAPSLILKVRVFGTRKWPIKVHYLGLELKTESFALLLDKNDKPRSLVDVKKPYKSRLRHPWLHG